MQPETWHLVYRGSLLCSLPARGSFHRTTAPPSGVASLSFQREQEPNLDLSPLPGPLPAPCTVLNAIGITLNGEELEAPVGTMWTEPLNAGGQLWVELCSPQSHMLIP